MEADPEEFTGLASRRVLRMSRLPTGCLATNGCNGRCRRVLVGESNPHRADRTCWMRLELWSTRLGVLDVKMVDHRIRVTIRRWTEITNPTIGPTPDHTMSRVKSGQWTAAAI